MTFLKAILFYFRESSEHIKLIHELFCTGYLFHYAEVGCVSLNENLMDTQYATDVKTTNKKNPTRSRKEKQMNSEI